MASLLSAQNLQGMQKIAIDFHDLFLFRDRDGNSRCVSFLKCDDYKFITAGEYTMRLWTMDPTTFVFIFLIIIFCCFLILVVFQRLSSEDFQFGSFKRVMTCVAVDLRDQRAYCGTTSGDVLMVLN